MLNERARFIVSNYWATHLGCTPQELFAEPFSLFTREIKLADNRSVLALFRKGVATVSIPSGDALALQPRLSSLRAHCSPERFVSVFNPISSVVLGPASIGYAEAVPQPAHPARTLGPDNAVAYSIFQQSCDKADWERGGSPPEHPRSAVFVGERIAALAGYAVWGGTIAHIAVITHPDFRGRSFGRSAVAHLASRAIAAGLLPQYRTLESNLPSLRVAELLGFHIYATSLAARILNHD